jgi:hypothetical protein
MAQQGAISAAKDGSDALRLLRQSAMANCIDCVVNGMEPLGEDIP